MATSSATFRALPEFSKVWKSGLIFSKPCNFYLMRRRGRAGLNEVKLFEPVNQRF